MTERSAGAAREVREALEEFEGVLREVNPIVASRLLPGITDEELHRVEEKYEVVIPEEAAAVWRWHNGLPDTGEPGCQDLLGVSARFLSLDDALESGRRRVQVPVSMFAELGMTHVFEGRTFIALLDDNVGYVIEVTPGEPVLTYLLAPDSLEMAESVVLPVAERVRWWSTALRTKAWVADETGTWSIGDEDAFPGPPYEDVF